MRSVNLRRAVAFAVLALAAAQAAAAPARSLKVSENGRYLQLEDGQPFFYLADTAWELFHRLDREEAVRYLDNRARLGFTAVQAVAIAELDGVRRPNAYFTRVPAPEMIVGDPVASLVPGAGTRRFAATRDANGSFACVYAPVGRAFTVDLSSFASGRLRSAWMNPRDGSFSPWESFARTPTRRFIPPAPGELLDWVLVVEAEHT